MNEGFTRVRLITGQLKMVRDLTLPPFEKMPTVILYGHRAFRRITVADSAGHIYAEVTSYAVPFEDVEEEGDQADD